MKNGFKPGVHEKYGLYVGNWEYDTKQGELAIADRVGQPIKGWF